MLTKHSSRVGRASWRGSIRWSPSPLDAKPHRPASEALRRLPFRLLASGLALSDIACEHWEGIVRDTRGLQRIKRWPKAISKV